MAFEEAVCAAERAGDPVSTSHDERRPAATQVERRRRTRRRGKRGDEEDQNERQVAARGKRGRRDHGGIGRKGDREPFAEEKERDQRIAVVGDEPHEMCRHVPNASPGARRTC